MKYNDVYFGHDRRRNLHCRDDSRLSADEREIRFDWTHFIFCRTDNCRTWHQQAGISKYFHFSMLGWKSQSKVRFPFLVFWVNNSFFFKCDYLY